MRKVACILALATAGATLATIVPAAAQETITIAVPLYDLNLDAPAGRETLKHRIDAAARRACDAGVQATPMERVDFYACVHKASHRTSTQLAARPGASGLVRTAR